MTLLGTYPEVALWGHIIIVLFGVFLDFHTVFYSGYGIIHSHQQCLRTWIFLHFTITYFLDIFKAVAILVLQRLLGVHSAYLSWGGGWRLAPSVHIGHFTTVCTFSSRVSCAIFGTPQPPALIYTHLKERGRGRVGGDRETENLKNKSLKIK